MRESMLGLLLVVAGACVVRGFFLVGEAAGWIMLGCWTASVAWLLFGSAGDAK